MGGVAVDGQRQWKLTKPAGGSGGASASVAADAVALSATAVNATEEPPRPRFQCGVQHGATVDPSEGAAGRSRWGGAQGAGPARRLQQVRGAGLAQGRSWAAPSTA